MNIVVDQTEQKVGNYELDILGHIEENDAVVIIENQLNTTDHGHMGQLIAYAAGLDAAIVIWIAPDVRDEHRSSIEWLNRHTDGKVRSFLVRPEVFRIDNSNPAIRFFIEAGPSDGIIRPPTHPLHEFRRKFWGDFLQYLVEHGHDWAKGRNTTKESWLSFSVGKAGLGVNVSMALRSRMRVEIFCSNDPEKLLFDQLFIHKADINSKFPGEEVSWERLDDGDSRAWRVAVYRPYERDHVAGDTQNRRDLYAWILRNLETFRTIAKQELVERQDVATAFDGEVAPSPVPSP